MSTPAPGYYPDPRPSHRGMQAYWDGTQWHLHATKPTETLEWVAIIAGVLSASFLGLFFPPAFLLIVGVGIWYHFHNKEKKRQARVQWEWDRQHGQP